MKRIPVLTCLILCSCLNNLFAQSQAQLDSLRRMLPGQTDTAAILTMLHISKHHVFLGPQPDSVAYYGQLALERSLELDYRTGQERALFCLANAYGLKQEYEKSNEYYEHTLEILRDMGNKKGIAAALNNIGRNYLLDNQLEQALEYFLQSMRVEEERGESANLYSSYNNIAIVQHMLEQYEEALENRKRAYRGHLALGDTYQVAQTLINLVTDYHSVGKADSARICAEEALDISESIGMQEGVVRSCGHLAMIALEELDYSLTLRYAQRVIAEGDTNYHASTLSHAYRFLSVAHDSLGQPALSLAHAQKSLHFAEKNQTAPELLNSYNLMYRVYKKLGQSGKALQFKETYHTLRDSLYNLDKEARITALQAQYNQERDKRALAEQANRIQEKNYLILALVAGVLMLGALFFLFNRQQILKEKQQTLEARQRLLRTQINPHFLFNALSSIQQVIYEKDDRKLAMTYLTRFARLMRLILENSREAYIPLDQEVDTLRLYLELQKMRFQDSFDYEILVDPEIDPEEVMIPPMFAQPFIENSLEHGILHKNGRGVIRLVFRKEGETLRFEVEDNGVGREQAAFFKTNKTHRSLATEITRDRLNLLSKAVNQQVNLEITDKVDERKQVTGTRVTFSLPLMYG